MVTTLNVRWPCNIIGTDALRDLALLRVDNFKIFDAAALYVTENIPPQNAPAVLWGMRGGLHDWKGKVTGYFGKDMMVKGEGTREGDSGGPILVGNSVVSIINEYMPEDALTVGPNNVEILEFIQGSGVTMEKKN